MKLITYAEKREKNLMNKAHIIKKYDAFNGLLTGEMEMVLEGKKGKRIFQNKHFESLAKKPAGEMSIGELKDLLKQAVVDIASEQSQTPPLYLEIYDELKDESFPATLEVKDVIGLQSAFTVVGNGEAVPLADFKVKDMGQARFKTYATGYSITEEWVAFNQFWKIEMANKAIGVAHNAILDHMHLSPIILGEYKDKKKTDKVAKTGDTPLQIVYNSLRAGLKDSLKRKNARGYVFKPTVALCNSATAMDVMSAVKGETEKGKTMGSIGMIDKIIAYDGWAGKVNGVDYDFVGPKDNEVFLIEPKVGFKALVKKEVTRLEQKGNVLTLGNLDVVEFFIRAFVADIDGAVHKVIVG